MSTVGERWLVLKRFVFHLAEQRSSPDELEQPKSIFIPVQRTGTLLSIVHVRVVETVFHFDSAGIGPVQSVNEYISIASPNESAAVDYAFPPEINFDIVVGTNSFVERAFGLKLLADGWTSSLDHSVLPDLSLQFGNDTED